MTRNGRRLCGLLGLALCLAAQAARAQDQCKLSLLAALPMQTIQDGRVTIPAAINGHEYRFMVDTGGYVSTIPDYIVEREKLYTHASGTGMVGVGNTFMNTNVLIPEFAIGRLHGKDFYFFVTDSEGLAAEGILGPQFLSPYDLDLDFVHEKFSLFSQDHCPDRVVYWTQAPAAVIPMDVPDKAHIRIPIKLDGKGMHAIVDTGAGTSYLSMDSAQRYLGIGENDPGLMSGKKEVLNGMSTKLYRYPFKTLDLGGVVVQNPHIVLVPKKAMKAFDDMVLGVGILRQLHVYIAYKDQKLYVTPAMAH